LGYSEDSLWQKNMKFSLIQPLHWMNFYLCSSVGWEDYMNFDVAETSIQKSIYSVTVKESNDIIGMGRIERNYECISKLSGRKCTQIRHL
jgi:hypothetical protein